MNDTRRFSLVKPSLNTPFHIDFNWWKGTDNNWRIFLHDYLCAEHREALSTTQGEIQVDTVDPETAEVRQVDGLQHLLISHCARQPDFVTTQTAMVDAVFRVLLASGNQPMTPVQLGEAINQPAEKILRTFSGATVYKGIRPVHH